MTYNFDDFYIDPNDPILDWTNIYDFDPGDLTQTPDVLRTGEVFPVKLPNSQFMMTKGRWKLFISNPANATTVFERVVDSVSVVGEFGPEVKDYVIEKTVLDLENNMLEVTINIIHNPIPILIIYGAIAGILAIIGSITINSVLTKIEKVTEPVFDIVSKPMVWAIIAIFLLPILKPFIGKVKG